MEKNALPNDDMMEALRQDGVFICKCAEPEPELVPLFGEFQCKNCMKLIARP
jgi:hypothetical protein